jgi:hypothetical protein
MYIGKNKYIIIEQNYQSVRMNFYKRIEKKLFIIFIMETFLCVIKNNCEGSNIMN